MGSISIRGLDDELSSLLKKAAATEKMSVNQFVLETIKKHLGLAKEKRFSHEWHDLDGLFGQWTDEEFSQIQGKIDDERQVDDELWK